MGEFLKNVEKVGLGYALETVYCDVFLEAQIKAADREYEKTIKRIRKQNDKLKRSEGYKAASKEYEKKLQTQYEEFSKKENNWEVDKKAYEDLIKDYKDYIKGLNIEIDDLKKNNHELDASNERVKELEQKIKEYEERIRNLESRMKG